MKTDALLYECIDELNEKEANLLEKIFSDNRNLKETQTLDLMYSREELNTQKRQENLVLDKMKHDMKNATNKATPKVRFWGKRRAVLLAATFILMIGMVTFAKEHDWDIQMADMLGISEAMEELDGGYVKVGASAISDDVTITVSQLIGDKNCMWVQLDTNVPWTAGENGYYLFDDSTKNCYHKPSQTLTGGITSYSYNNNGFVSFMIEFYDYDNINRATIDLWMSKLVMYEPTGDETGNEIETIVCEGEWILKWDNYYAANTVTKNPLRIVTLKENGEKLTCVIKEVEISPVSIQIKGWKSPTVHTDNIFNLLDSVILEDGTEIECFCTQSGINNFEVEGFISLSDFPEIDMTQIEYVVIGGEKIKIK